MKPAAIVLMLLLGLNHPSFALQAATQAPATPGTTAPATPPLPNTLLDGTPVKLRLTEDISSEKEKKGESVPFEVVDQVDVQGVPVILKGANALATVTNAVPKRRMGRGGKLDVSIESVRSANGQRIKLRAVRENNGGGHVGAMTGAMAATTIVFYPAAPLFLLMHGKSVEIPKGTEVTAFVQGDTLLNMSTIGSAGRPRNPAVRAAGRKATNAPTGRLAWPAAHRSRHDASHCRDAPLRWPNRKWEGQRWNQHR